MRNKKGFTLIELLVVIAIIGLLATLSVVALNNARLKSRDAKRVSDIKQVQTALELYFVDNNTYPATPADELGEKVADNCAGAACDAQCLDQGGFDATCVSGAGNTIYMGQVPQDPKVESTGTTDYAYTYTGGDTYTIVFGLAGATGGLTCSPYDNTCCTATQDGIICN